jgi:acetyl-CoA carboxylase carboxyltransferase component
MAHCIHSTPEEVAEALNASAPVLSLTAPDEDTAFALAVQVLDYLPTDSGEAVEVVDADDLNRLLPQIDADDAAALLQGMADNGTALELYPAWGKEIRTALARVGGYPCGLVVSDARVNDGELAPDAARKAAQLVNLCDYYGLPVISLINSRGIQVPDEKSQADTMQAAAGLLNAYAGSDTIKISVIVGNAIGSILIYLLQYGLRIAIKSTPKA